ncbi:MAG: hypothetical protein L0H94_08210, partial [Nitrospira sp.]|nr:hypothetical protein [Nitrospira sp.]
MSIKTSELGQILDHVSPSLCPSVADALSLNGGPAENRACRVLKKAVQQGRSRRKHRSNCLGCQACWTLARHG